jgi:hypothetical protein
VVPGPPHSAPPLARLLSYPSWLLAIHELPTRGLLGNRASGVRLSRKPGFMRCRLSETKKARGHKRESKSTSSAGLLSAQCLRTQGFSRDLAASSIPTTFTELRVTLGG